MTVAGNCPSCKKYAILPVAGENSLNCPQCGTGWGRINTEEVFEKCFACDCRHFYRHKDFNRALGCLIMLVGIILVPFTYGISLPVLAIFDWMLHRRTPEVALCYRCGMEFRGFEIPSWINTFRHSLGEKYQSKSERGEG